MKNKSIWGAVFSGCLLTLSFPNFNLEVLAWAALIPLILVSYNQDVRRSFYLGFLCGIIHYLGAIYWVAYTLSQYGKLNWFLSIALLLVLAAYMALYIGVFTALSAWGYSICGDSFLFAAPFLWVSLEYLRTFMLSGFPWALLGYSQYLNLWIIQIADITGVYGVSFLILLVNYCLAAAIWRFMNTDDSTGLIPCWRIVAGCAIIIILCLSYGFWRVESLNQEVQKYVPLKVALIQGNIQQDKKWDPAYQDATMNIYKRLSDEAAGAAPQLIVWPETATPFYFQSDEKYQAQIFDWTVSWKSWLLFGSPSYEFALPKPKLYNSAYLVSASKSVAVRYHKIHLVPFGEYIPLKSILGFAGKLVAQVGDFSSGEEYKILQIPQGKFGVGICFEVIFPQLVRKFFDRGAQFLVNITNDAWFGDTSAPLQHFSMLVLRAVENHTYVVRAANTGISGFIDPTGQIMSASHIFVEDYLIGNIRLIKNKTFYAEYGDVFSWLCIIIYGLWIFRVFRLKGKCNCLKN